MKKNFSLTLLSFVIFSLIATAQNSKSSPESYEVMYPGCERAHDPNACMKRKLSQFYLENLKKESFKITDTVDGKIYSTLYLSLDFDDNGNYTSRLVTDVKDTTQMKDLYRINHRLPKMKMLSDDRGYGIAGSYSASLRYELVMKEDSVLNVFYRPLTKNDEEVAESMDVIERVPVYRGCRAKSNKELKACMSRKMAKFVSKRFDTRIATLPHIKESRIKILCSFVVDTDGRLDDIRVEAKHKELEEEAIRVLKKIPKLKPGLRDGEPVRVIYKLPIVFGIER